MHLASTADFPHRKTLNLPESNVSYKKEGTTYVLHPLAFSNAYAVDVISFIVTDYSELIVRN